MVLLDIRQRTGWLFLAVMIGHIILISAQVNTQRGVPLVEAVTFGVFAEVQRAATAAINGVQGVWANYVALQTIRVANERLTEEVAELRIALQEERAMAQRSRALEDLLELRSQVPLSTTAAAIVHAAVIGGGASPEFRTMTIDKGTRDGVRADMAVIAPDGVVGRVITPSARASKVQLLIDSSAAAGAVVERSRAQGVVTGGGTDELAMALQMEYLPGTADIVAGDLVVTSGLDGIYPKGFAIGRIESIRRGAGEFRSVIVRPSVNYSTLEAVLVVLSAPGLSGDGEVSAGTEGE